MKDYITIRVQEAGFGRGSKHGTLHRLANDATPPEGAILVPEGHPWADKRPGEEFQFGRDEEVPSG